MSAIGLEPKAEAAPVDSGTPPSSDSVGEADGVRVPVVMVVPLALGVMEAEAEVTTLVTVSVVAALEADESVAVEEAEAEEEAEEVASEPPVRAMGPMKLFSSPWRTSRA